MSASSEKTESYFVGSRLPLVPVQAAIDWSEKSMEVGKIKKEHKTSLLEEKSTIGIKINFLLKKLFIL